MPKDMISRFFVFDAICKGNSTSIPRVKPEEGQTHKASFELQPDDPAQSELFYYRKRNGKS